MKKISCLITVLIFLAFNSCNGGSGKGAGDISDIPVAVTAEIGPEGGVLNGAHGSSIEIPAGALAEIMTITMTPYITENTLPAEWQPIPGFAGAVDLGPDGAVFLLPVKITIPEAIRRLKRRL